MLLKYPLTDSQYARFQHANNDDQIQALGAKAGVTITDETVVGGVETMYFKGRCNGTMALVPMYRPEPRALNEPVLDHWECWIQIRSKPWWLPWFVLDWGFKEALK
jgi:hypothetical protein